MKCMKCGYENHENSPFCQGCGSPLGFRQNPLPGRMPQLLNDGLFLALCIVSTASAGLSLLSGSLPLIQILMSIFLWLLFYQGKNGIADTSHMRHISGTIYASYVINWVVCCLIGVCGLLFLIFPFILGTANLTELIKSGTIPYVNNYSQAFASLASFSFILLAAFFLVVAAAIALFNLFGWRSIHRFAQSLYISLDCGQANLAKRSKAQAWLLAFGILKAVMAVPSLASASTYSFQAEACAAATMIIGSILIGKHFGDFQ